MFKKYLLITGFIIIIALLGCSKKTHPSRTVTATDGDSNTEIAVKKNDLPVTKKTVIKPKAVFPKVITVNDSAAHKSVDGRYYYDVLGHRYWRNNKDGKYYLFNKSMYRNEAFKPEKK